MFSAILAIGKNGELGQKGDMPWGRKLSSDLEFVKKMTIGKTLVMGSNTFNSLPKLLPSRQHFVVTKNINELDEKYDPSNPNITIISDLDLFLNNNDITEKEFVIFGGASIYNQCITYCSKIYITLIDQTFEKADTFFKYNFDDKLYLKTKLGKYTENGLSYTRYLYEKK